VEELFASLHNDFVEETGPLGAEVASLVFAAGRGGTPTPGTRRRCCAR